MEATKVWADLEEAQGHRLWRSDLLNHFRQKLDSAIAFAPEDQEKGCFDKGKAKELNAWIAKQTAMMKDKSKRDKQSAYLVKKDRFRRTIEAKTDSINS